MTFGRFEASKIRALWGRERLLQSAAHSRILNILTGFLTAYSNSKPPYWAKVQREIKSLWWYNNRPESQGTFNMGQRKLGVKPPHYEACHKMCDDGFQCVASLLSWQFSCSGGKILCHKCAANISPCPHHPQKPPQKEPVAACWCHHPLQHDGGKFVQPLSIHIWTQMSHFPCLMLRCQAHGHRMKMFTWWTYRHSHMSLFHEQCCRLHQSLWQQRHKSTCMWSWHEEDIAEVDAQTVLYTSSSSIVPAIAAFMSRSPLPFSCKTRIPSYHADAFGHFLYPNLNEILFWEAAAVSSCRLLLLNSARAPTIRLFIAEKNNREWSSTTDSAILLLSHNKCPLWLHHLIYIPKFNQIFMNINVHLYSSV